MALFPEIQARAQAELDRVVGPDRLPEFEDLEQLPYIHALAMEVTRWMPIVPFVPHAASADDTYRSYFISKGTMFLAVSRLSDVADLPVLIVYFLEHLVRFYSGVGVVCAGELIEESL